MYSIDSLLFLKINSFFSFLFRYFVDQKPIWEEDKSLVLSGRLSNLVDESIAQYTGGYILVMSKFNKYNVK